MEVMVVGSGGQEHALAWKLARSSKVQMMYMAPGNGGTALDKRPQNLPITDPEVLAASAEREDIHFAVVGPGAPLVAGIVDLFHAKDLRIFGPTKATAQLESSRDFAKAFMHRHGIPTAKYQTFSDTAQTYAYAGQEGAPIVVKTDGLTAGRDVVAVMTAEEAHSIIDVVLADNHLDDAGVHVVVEEFLVGEEASFTVVCDDKNVVALAISQDRERLLGGGAGPNTGGMDAYSLAPVVTPTLHTHVLREIIMPTIRGMEKDGIPYTGFLYAGLIIDTEGSPRALEFNCRIGDLETQPTITCMKTDLYDVLSRAINSKLGGMELGRDRRTTLGVVTAAHNYSDTPRKDDVVTGILKETKDSVTFHVGTTLKGGVLTTSDDRMLCAVGLADTAKAAQRAAYNVVERIHSDGTQYRTGIGHRAIRY